MEQSKYKNVRDVIYNVYKPRYRINNLAKSKVWPYKNSRLRGFFTIRSRKLVQGNLFRRFVLVFNNLKWTTIRKFIRPYEIKQKPEPKKYRYRTSFYEKQQFLNFYGKIKENNFRNFFKSYLVKASTNNHYFFVALENRLDMVFFRLRLLPTIYSCHQLIHHHGLAVNSKFKYAPNYIVQPGDIISIQQRNIFYALQTSLVYRLQQRQFAKFVLKRRIFTLLKKKSHLFFQTHKGYVNKTKLKILRKFFMLKYYLQNFQKELSKTILWLLQKYFDHFDTQINNFQNEEVVLTFYIQIFKKIFSLKKNFKYFVQILKKNYDLNFKSSNTITTKIQKTIRFKSNKIKSWNLFKNKSLIQDTFVNKIKYLNAFYIKQQMSNSTTNPKTLLNFERRSIFKKLIQKQLKFNSEFKQKNQQQKLLLNKRTAKKDSKVIKKELPSLYQKAMFQIFSAYRLLNFLELKISYCELDFYNSILSQYVLKTANKHSLKEEKNFNNFKIGKVFDQDKFFLIKKLLISEETVLLEKYNLKKAQIDQSFIFFFRIFLKKILKKQQKIKNSFLLGSTLKKNRRIQVPRLKKVHWYIPKYLYFHANTFRCLILKQTSSDEIHHPFRCSLKKLYVFYKSLAF